MLSALDGLGYISPTPIQAAIIPLVLSGKDCLAQAPTGTGKTCAFGIPVVEMLSDKTIGVQAIILCPTRELVLQIETELKKLAANKKFIKILSIYGGQNIDRQLAGLRKHPQIVVGTTGRVMDHLRRKTLKLDSLKCIVLDEADEMLNMGFREDIDTILTCAPTSKVQTLLFSATMPKEILEISRLYQTDPETVKTTCEGMDMPVIKQYVVNLKEADKYEALKKIIGERGYNTVLIFCNTKMRADELNNKLNDDFYLSMALHGDLRQRERDKVMRSFRQKAINILVATDIAARGIDVDDIEAIFNFDIPYDNEYYIHRVGRTARANKSGVAYSFATSKDAARLKDCQKISQSEMLTYTLEGISVAPRGKQQKSFAVPTSRLFFNVGKKDGVTPETLASFITSKTTIKPEEIYEVKLLDIFGFVELDKNVVGDALALNGERCFKRKLSVELSDGRTPKGGDSAPQKSAERGKSERPATKRTSTKSGKPSFDFEKKGDKRPSGKPAFEKKPRLAEKPESGYQKKLREKADGGSKPFYGDRKPADRKQISNNENPYRFDGDAESKGAERFTSKTADRPRKTVGDTRRSASSSNGDARRSNSSSGGYKPTNNGKFGRGKAKPTASRPSSKRK